jgi:hypothetical protein
VKTNTINLILVFYLKPPLNQDEMGAECKMHGKIRQMEAMFWIKNLKGEAWKTQTQV